MYLWGWEWTHVMDAEQVKKVLYWSKHAENCEYQICHSISKSGLSLFYSLSMSSSHICIKDYMQHRCEICRILFNGSRFLGEMVRHRQSRLYVCKCGKKSRIVCKCVFLSRLCLFPMILEGCIPQRRRSAYLSLAGRPPRTPPRRPSPPQEAAVSAADFHAF